MTKALPNLEKGIQIVGFLSKMKEINETEEESDGDKQYSYLLYRPDTEVIQGVSKGCSELYGIPAGLSYGHPSNSVHELKLKHIFVESP